MVCVPGDWCSYTMYVWCPPRRCRCYKVVYRIEQSYEEKNARCKATRLKKLPNIYIARNILHNQFLQFALTERKGGRERKEDNRLGSARGRTRRGGNYAQLRDPQGCAVTRGSSFSPPNSTGRLTTNDHSIIQRIVCFYCGVSRKLGRNGTWNVYGGLAQTLVFNRCTGRLTAHPVPLIGSPEQRLRVRANITFYDASCMEYHLCMRCPRSLHSPRCKGWGSHSHIRASRSEGRPLFESSRFLAIPSFEIRQVSTLCRFCSSILRL